MNQNLSVLVSEIQNRARIYVHIYRELSKEVGEEKAAEIMKRALYERGREKGIQLARRLGQPDLHKMAIAFMEGKTDMDAFGHEIVQEHSDYVLLRLNRCPLAEAWEELGLTPEKQKALCDIAYQVDFGKYEAAGYKLAFSCRIADGGKSCDMKVTI
ncbi:MAG: L-2-amino-thiazoline-4-carboxylic acid hydrolase [Acidobacteria bacterium]|nr:L-2-amino-thiazoline-4-carboxylic acid hydrolase [Acidobacteriota bacterium]